jgi:hypothetical protein
VKYRFKLTTVWLCFLAIWISACVRQKPKNEVAETGKAATQAIEFDASRLVKFTAILKDHEGNRLNGVVGVLFAVYEQQTGGTPLWQEVQNVEADKFGFVATTVGSTRREGIQPEIFGTEKTRWLGTQVLLPGETEQSRIKLISTPNGLRAQRVTRLVVPNKPLNAVEGEVTGEGGDMASNRTPAQNPADIVQSPGITENGDPALGGGSSSSRRQLFRGHALRGRQP